MFLARAARYARRPSRSLWARLKMAFAMHRQRHSLMLLDDHLLADIGLTADQAKAEAARSVWDAPPHWQQG